MSYKIQTVIYVTVPTQDTKDPVVSKLKDIFEKEGMVIDVQKDNYKQCIQVGSIKRETLKSILDRAVKNEDLSPEQLSGLNFGTRAVTYHDLDEVQFNIL